VDGTGARSSRQSHIPKGEPPVEITLPM
jgi:hypothetical protein